MYRVFGFIASYIPATEEINMVRMNITMPEDIVKELRRVKNKSGFIAQTLREKFLVERKKATERLLEESYKKSAREDAALMKDWDVVSGDGVE